MLNVTYDGHVLAILTDEDDAILAHCIQIGALYIYDAKYDVAADGGSLPNTSNFFKCLLTDFWKLPQPSAQESKGKGGKGRKGAKKKKMATEPWIALRTLIEKHRDEKK